MGYNPNKKGPTPAKNPGINIGVGLFSDVYKALEKEYGKEMIRGKVGMAAVFMDEKGRGQLECMGGMKVMLPLTSLMIMRLATVQAQAVFDQTKGKNNPGLKETAKALLRDIEKRIDSLKDFDHAPMAG